mmetsp:Transcript_109681/g.306697  ORF Transcript_109681/g.306697 Transcript_109681/m.306697 type:complete len:213 (+) Transcript_109681:226-864(+)
MWMFTENKEEKAGFGGDPSSSKSSPSSRKASIIISSSSSPIGTQRGKRIAMDDSHDGGVLHEPCIAREGAVDVAGEFGCDSAPAHAAEASFSLMAGLKTGEFSGDAAANFASVSFCSSNSPDASSWPDAKDANRADRSSCAWPAAGSSSACKASMSCLSLSSNCAIDSWRPGSMSRSSSGGGLSTKVAPNCVMPECCASFDAMDVRVCAAST